MPSSAYSHVMPDYQSDLAVRKDELPGAPVVDRPGTFARKVVEFTFYAVTVNSLVLSSGGFIQLPPFFAGGLISALGAMAVVMMLAQGERLPAIFWIALVMSGGASLSEWVVSRQLPFVGESVRWLVLHACNLVVVYYIVQNESARKRALIVFAAMALAMVFVVGAQLTSTARQERLHLEGFGGSLGNANGLSFLTGFIAINLLFWSLRSTVVIRPFLWGLAAVLVLVMVRTVSRGGIGTFAVGFTLLTLTVLSARGVRWSGIIVILISIVVGFYLLSVAAESVEYLKTRFGEHSIRQDVFRAETLDQLWDSILFGSGGRVETVVGIRAHNSFITTHMDYGGLTAYPYLLMLVLLGVRTFRMFFAREYPLDLRMWIVTLLVMSLCYQFFSNQGFCHPESVLAFALISKYTEAYRFGALRTRRTLRQLNGAAGFYAPA